MRAMRENGVENATMQQCEFSTSPYVDHPRHVSVNRAGGLGRQCKHEQNTSGFLLWGREWQHCWGMLTRVTAYRSSHPAPGERMIESHTSTPPSSQQII